MMHCPLDPGAVLVGQLDGSVNFNAEVVDPRRILELVGGYANTRAFGDPFELAKCTALTRCLSQLARGDGPRCSGFVRSTASSREFPP